MEAARASATPVITPPPKKRAPFTCSVSKKKKRCFRRKQSCSTNTATKIRSCKVTTVRCRLVHNIKHCVTTVSRCTVSTRKTKKKAKRRCVITYVSRSNVRAASFDTSAAVPRMQLRRARAADPPGAGDLSLVSSTNVAPATVLDDASPQASPGRAGAGVGALILVFAALWLAGARRRTRTDS